MISDNPDAEALLTTVLDLCFGVEEEGIFRHNSRIFSLEELASTFLDVKLYLYPPCKNKY